MLERMLESGIRGQHSKACRHTLKVAVISQGRRTHTYRKAKYTGHKPLVGLEHCCSGPAIDLNYATDLTTTLERRHGLEQPQHQNS